MKICKNCEYCGKPFHTYEFKVAKGLGRFCSVKCSNTVKNKSFLATTNTKCIDISCKNCGNKMSIPPCLQERNRICCCSRCANEYKSKINSATCNCVHCGKDFRLKNSAAKRISRNQGKFCSKECMDKSRLRRKSCVCKKCGKTFEVRIGSHNKNIFCSRDCYIKDGGKRTSIEIFVENELIQMGLIFQSQKSIKNKDLC